MTKVPSYKLSPESSCRSRRFYIQVQRYYDTISYYYYSESFLVLFLAFRALVVSRSSGHTRLGRLGRRCSSRALWTSVRSFTMSDICWNVA